MRQEFRGRILDPLNKRDFQGCLVVEDGRVLELRAEAHSESRIIMPGFVDAHVHIESSMLPPAEFARLAVVHGTVGTVSDPHEIANVLGVAGLRFMLNNAAQSPLKICFGAPSCVPATVFETAGASISALEIDELFHDERIGYLSEVMNYPGVLNADPELMAKIASAKRHKRPVDGHAPGLRGEAARQYCAAGISTDHECYTLEEALEKIEYGMKILIREGSAAKNFEALHPLFARHPESLMLCSDDKHPDSLLTGHIDKVVHRALNLGYDLMSVLRAACVHPVQHYNLKVGLLREGDAADFIIVESIESMRVLETWIDGQCVARDGQSLLAHKQHEIVNAFNCDTVTPDSLCVDAAQTQRIRVIVAADGQLVTREEIVDAPIQEGCIVSSTEYDILKLVVQNRYNSAPPSIAFIRSFGLKRGAIASSVAHDSHNVIAVGTNDDDLAAAMNAVISARGGVAVCVDGECEYLALPIAGLMSDADGFEVARVYAGLDARARELGSQLASPFMTLSFMALLVIPQLKLSDLGLFDGGRFAFVSLDADSTQAPNNSSSTSSEETA